MTERFKEYYIQNSTNIEQVITLKEVNSCDSISSTLNTSQIVPANSEVKIIFPNDGLFDIFVDAIADGRAYYYKTLFDSMILYVRESLCGELGTNCIAVGQCATDKENVANSAISKLLLYTAYNKDKYDDALLQALQNITCSAKIAADKLAAQEKILGVSDTKKLLQIEIAELVLMLYNEDIATMQAGETEDGYRELYEYDVLIPCINALGIKEGTVVQAPCGIPHTASITATPVYTDRGVLTNILVTYNLDPKGDTFLRVVSSNVVATGTVDIPTFNGSNQSVNKTTDKDITYYIEYEYQRGNDTDVKKVEVFVNALEPQWFGGESATADFIVGGAIVDEASLVFDNANVKRFQTSSNTSTSNTDTQGRYIWWITKNRVDFSPGGIGKLPIGDFSTTDCSIGAPSTYAIVWKQGQVRLIDGTLMTYNFYRTCPLQYIQGQTLQYDVIQR